MVQRRYNLLENELEKHVSYEFRISNTSCTPIILKIREKLKHSGSRKVYFILYIYIYIPTRHSSRPEFLEPVPCLKIGSRVIFLDELIHMRTTYIRKKIGKCQNQVYLIPFS